tara:strand:+ start:84 stop:1160 length:1077 start_codon:yes stop_codon:yes gene_type:complete
MKVDIIAGARPNFIKIAPVIEAIVNKKDKISFRLIHTGQHYDKNMSGSFFSELGIPLPDVNFNAGGGSQAEQTSKIMIKYEALLIKESTDLCLVFGDVTSTMACSIVAKKFNIKVAHVEGGIRSFDLTMPEEINRILTDSISDYFFTTSEYANLNLRKQGVDSKNIFYVGNTMIDTLVKNIQNLKKPSLYDKLKLKRNSFFVLTMHRPSNVDQKKKLKEFLVEIENLGRNYPIVFPCHPRTKIILNDLSFNFNSLKIIPPLSYLEFNYLVKNSKCVITDSGGITEEATYLKIPCMTLRDNTERPETIALGTNELVGTNPKKLKPYFDKLFNGNWKSGSIPKYWDGETSKRIVNHLLEL